MKEIKDNRTGGEVGVLADAFEQKPEPIAVLCKEAM